MARDIPSDLIDRIAVEADGQDAAIAPLRELSVEAVSRRPDPKTWSVLEHIEHLNLTNRAYLKVMTKCVEDARARGLTGSPPWKLSWLGGYFVKMMAPPVKRRFKTVRSITPQPNLDAQAVFDGFDSTQAEIRRLAEAARGLDLGKATLRSPLMPLLKFQLGAAFMVIQTHNRRHFWNIANQRADTVD